jgi:tRNA (guanine-N7-)-methyltransferase
MISRKNEIAAPSARNDAEERIVIARTCLLRSQESGRDEAISDAPSRLRKIPQEKYAPVVFSEIFGNSNPVEMEIGCGKGKFLVARSIANPGTNFLGVDRVSKFMNIGKTRAQKRELPNIRFIRAEAKAFLTDAIAPGSVSIFHIYFSDPWPKRRHQPRRVFTEEFLRLLHARLVAGGLVEIATDDKDYFDAMKKTIAATAQLWDNVRETVNERILDSMNKTSYELKWAAEGRSLYYAELKKK